MKRRIKIGIFLILIIVLVALLVFLWWWFSRPEEPVVAPPPVQTEGLLIPDGLPITNENEQEIEVQNRYAELTSIAKSFAERFGSYSNESNFVNLDELRPQMTTKMRAWAESYKADTAGGQEFYGVTTIATNAVVDTYDVDLQRAEVTVTTQRKENKIGTDNPRIFYQSLNLKMMLEGSEWKIDEANWQ